MDAKELLIDELEKRLRKARRKARKLSAVAAMAWLEADVWRQLHDEELAGDAKKRQEQANKERDEWRALVDQIERELAMLVSVPAQPFDT